MMWVSLPGILYGNNIRAVLDDEASINLGSVYESVVASELIAHGYELFYYDNRHKGEVVSSSTIMPPYPPSLLK